MKLGRILLLAGVAYAANQFLKTEKGKQLKKDVAGKAGEWKDKLNDMMHKNGNGAADLFEDANPTGSSYKAGSGSPL